MQTQVFCVFYSVNVIVEDTFHTAKVRLGMYQKFPEEESGHCQ